MASPQIREAQVDLLLRDGELTIEGHHVWHESANKSWVRADIPVRNTKSASLRLCVTANQTIPDRYRLALLFNTTLRIRGLCIKGNHTNKHTNRDRWINQTHVHKWSDDCQDRFAEPSEIDGTSIQELLERFCAECNIACSATLADMPQHQPEMLL
jgi:hypothetical protein